MKKIIVLLLMLTFALSACGGDETDNLPEYPYDDYYNATITSTEVDGSTTVITVETIGFHPANIIIIDVTFKNGTMTNFEVIEHGETPAYGGALIDDKQVLEAIIEDAVNLDSIEATDYSDIDVTAGSTITIEAFLDAARASVKHFNTYYE